MIGSFFGTFYLISRHTINYMLLSYGWANPVSYPMSTEG